MKESIMLVLCAYIAVMSLTAFAAMGIDKRKAQKGTWRIRESTLLLLCFLGGGLGCISGMKVFRHKTRHTKFRILVPLSLILWIAVLVVFVRFYYV